MSINMVDKLLTIGEVAERLRVHYRTALEYVATGQITGYKQGKTWRVKESDLEAYIDSQYQKREDPPRQK